MPRENCRKLSKNFLTLFDDFWRFLPCAKIVEKYRKTFWHFLTIFDVFWRGPFPPAPFAIRWHDKQNVHRIVPGLSRDCRFISWDFLGNLFMCFPFPPRKRQHINKVDPHPLPGQSREVVYVYWFFLPRKIDPPLSCGNIWLAIALTQSVF